MKLAEQMVMVIDDDPSVRTAIAQLLGAVGLTSETFASGEEFLEADLSDLPRCLVLDVRLPGLSGLNLQRELSERKIDSDYFHYRAWRYSNDRTGHESRSCRVSQQAFSRPGPA
jgi:DNA-binding NtrC family response regulator